MSSFLEKLPITLFAKSLSFLQPDTLYIERTGEQAVVVYNGKVKGPFAALSAVSRLGPVPKFIMPRFEIISRAGYDERVGAILKILPLSAEPRSS